MAENTTPTKKLPVPPWVQVVPGEVPGTFRLEGAEMLPELAIKQAMEYMALLMEKAGLKIAFMPR